ncbi:beta-L-arabinofuranosidase domain-containing protein [Leeuwenhoekiella sp. W20_SRS_FM14]|uniref:beta-L-arabinofuranosidase domain-containing protein n=1 Tax=Leeuwenhoekiella sp. W20_SRS_FM14 TaxID=3240270 RepID=UPI003F995F49
MNAFKFSPYLVFYFLCAIFYSTQLHAQNGDQILDGIGETGLIARYIFDENVKDWSRNNLHATINTTENSYVEDPVFDKVLHLKATSKTYITLPAATLNDIESLSISGWIYLNSEIQNAAFFNFGKNTTTQFFVAPSGTKKENGLVTRISNDSKVIAETKVDALPVKKWQHITVVIDFPAQTMHTYINGELAKTAGDLKFDLDAIFGKNPVISIGKSLDAKLHDFRIYRIPLSENQINTIYNNSLKGEEGVVNERKELEDDLPQFPKDTPQLYNQFLTGVSDVTVTTLVGQLPRLPRYVNGMYKKGIKGPQVRVLWPAPTDNASVLKTGTYEVTGNVPGTSFKPKATVTVTTASTQNTPERKLETFDLSAVSLNADSQGHSSKFIENRDKFINTLVETNPDAFLYMFRNAFGQPQPEGAEPLGVWDSQETKLRGHATGHYLTAIAQAYASTSYDVTLQKAFAKKIDYMVNTLYELSQRSGKPKTAGGSFVSEPTAVPVAAGKTGYDSDLSEAGIRTDYWNWGTGFISAYPPDQFIMLEHGAKYGTENTKIWAPYYTLHKILAGLMDVYEVTGNEKALEVAKGMGDWVHARLSQVPTETLISMWNTYIAGEFGGMNEAMARLSRITNQPRYLETAKLFDNIDMFYGDAQHSHGLAKNVDTFRGLHANQHIPQIVGALEMYRDSNAPEYFKVADNFWYKTKNDYMYSIGGVAGARNPANAECFVSQPATLYENGLSSGGQNETCGTYNMLKLTRNLFLYDQRPEYMDYYEQGLYNQILASVAEDSPANTYHISLRPGSQKHFGNADMKGFTCCNGTALESSTKLQNSIYFKNEDNTALYVNLYIPSTLDWKERNITIKQETAFPKEDHTLLTINGTGKFDLNVRVPSWATGGFTVKINGKVQKTKAVPGTYISINRTWKNGDTVELTMPFQFHLDPVMDQQNIASLFYGPVLLAAQEDAPRKDWRKIVLKANNLGETISGNPEHLEFTIDGVIFKPFYETYGRHSVYLDVALE